MPPAKVTKESVWSLCDIMSEKGQEPSILLLREALGDIGSYTTIKSYLDSWKSRRQLDAQATIPMPEQVARRAQQLGQELWNMAALDAQERIAEVMSASEDQVAQAEDQVAQAEQEISRLERVAEDLRRQLGDQAGEMERLRLAEARAQQAAEDAKPLRDELRQAQAELRAAARLEGQVDELRSQLARKQIAISQLRTQRKPPEK